MKIIDCFCGVGPWRSREPSLPYRAEDLLGLMDHFGIERAVVYGNGAASACLSLQVNSYPLEAAKLSRRFLPAFTLIPHPHKRGPSAEEQFEQMRDADVRAAWIWIAGNRFTNGLWDWQYEELLEGCQHRRIPTFLKVEEMVLPDDVNRLCEKYPKLRLVLMGVGYISDRWVFPLLKRHKELRVSLGHYYIPSGGPMRFVEHFGAERLIFGSGLPHFSPGGLITHVTYSTLSDSDKAKILSGNLERLMAEVRR